MSAVHTGRVMCVASGSVAAIAAMLACGEASAQDAWLRGEWCADNGERMVVERDGLGFNEHTGCKWAGKRPSGEKVNVLISCVNTYGENQRVDQGQMRFRAVKTGPRSVSVRIGSGGAVAYQKC